MFGCLASICKSSVGVGRRHPCSHYSQSVVNWLVYETSVSAATPSWSAVLSSRMDQSCWQNGPECSRIAVHKVVALLSELDPVSCLKAQCMNLLAFLHIGLRVGDT